MGSKFGILAQQLKADALRLRTVDKKPVREISQLLQVSEPTVWKWIKGQTIPKGERWVTRLKNFTGMRFGKLLVLHRAPNHITSGGLSQTCWWVRCDCGQEKPVRAGSLRTGSTTSCGCDQGKSQIPGLSLRNYVLRAYKASAKHRGIGWQLTDEQFDALAKQNCHYCKVEPFTTLKKRGYLGSYTYNGIDRTNNSKGYTMDNVVPCCKICNYAKGRSSYEEFIAWLNRVRQLAHRAAGV